MDAGPWTAAPYGIMPRRARSLDHLLCWAWRGSVVLLPVLSVFLLQRRLAGGLRQPLPAATLIAVGILIGIGVSLLRLAGRRVRQRSSLWSDLALPSLALALLAASVSLPGSAPGALLVFWLVLAGEESIWWLGALRLRWNPPAAKRELNSHNSPECQERIAGTPPHPENVATLEDLAADGETPSALPLSVTQRMTRTRTADGQERIVGIVRSEFQPGERTQNVHLAFCPPLDRRPDFRVHQMQGPPAVVKAAQVECFGVRLELRLAAKSARRESLLVRFDASPPEVQPPEGDKP